MTYPIPDEALANHIAILGKTGSGKSNGAKTLAERALDRGERVCVLDPTGTWYGLRLTRKGKPSPYKVVIFGGRHGDVPITGAHGAAIAETVGTTSTPAVIDTRLMTVADRTRFFTDFAEALLRTNQGPLTLIIDEAHLFAPQGRVNDPQSGAMVHAANNLVSLGRGLGLRIVLISQRPAKLHKDSLTQVETLVAMRLIAPQDREAVRDWIKEAADLEQGKEIIASMASLPTGDAWVWSPEIGVLRRGHFPLASTFDSGSMQANAEGGPHLGALDIAEVTARLDQVAADVRANDPRALKAELVRVTAELAQARRSTLAADPAAIAAAEERGHAQGYSEGFEAGSAAMWGQANEIISDAGLALSAARKADWDKGRTVGHAAPASAFPPKRQPEPEKSTGPAFVNRSETAPAFTGGEPSLTGPQRHLLGSLAWWAAMGHETPTRTQVAAFAGWTPKGSNLRNRLSELSARGLVDYPRPGVVRLTTAGKAAAPAPDLARTLLDSIRSILTGPQSAILEAMLAQPMPMTRADLAGALGWEAGGSNLRNRLSELSALELVEYPAKGSVALQDWVTA